MTTPPDYSASEAFSAASYVGNAVASVKYLRGSRIELDGVPRDTHEACSNQLMDTLKPISRMSEFTAALSVNNLDLSSLGISGAHQVQTHGPATTIQSAGHAHDQFLASQQNTLEI